MYYNDALVSFELWKPTKCSSSNLKKGLVELVLIERFFNTSGFIMRKTLIKIL